MMEAEWIDGRWRQLRTMAPDDLGPVLAIEEASQPTPWTLGNFRDCLNSGYHCRVLTLDDEPVAFMVLSCVLDETHLLNLAVAPAWQRQGLAHWMLSQALTQAKAEKMSVLYLEVRASNWPARRLYQCLGFQENGQRRNYYRTATGHEDAVLMSALL